MHDAKMFRPNCSSKMTSNDIFCSRLPAYCITYLCLNLKIGSNAKSYISGCWTYWYWLRIIRLCDAHGIMMELQQYYNVRIVCEILFILFLRRQRSEKLYFSSQAIQFKVVAKPRNLQTNYYVAIDSSSIRL